MWNVYIKWNLCTSVYLFRSGTSCMLSLRGNGYRRNKEMTSNRSNDITGSAFIHNRAAPALRGEHTDYFQGFLVFKWLLRQPNRAVDSYNTGGGNPIADMSQEAGSPVSFNQSDPMVSTMRWSAVVFIWLATFPDALSFGARWLVNPFVFFSTRFTIGWLKVDERSVKRWQGKLEKSRACLTVLNWLYLII